MLGTLSLGADNDLLYFLVGFLTHPLLFTILGWFKPKRRNLIELSNFVLAAPGDKLIKGLEKLTKMDFDKNFTLTEDDVLDLRLGLEGAGYAPKVCARILEAFNEHRLVYRGRTLVFDNLTDYPGP